LIKRLAFLLIIIIVVFWPVWYYRSELRFDSAIFTTEWLKIAFSSVILFLIVELFLDRNRAAAARSTFQSVFAREIAQPLSEAGSLVSNAQEAAIPGSDYAATDLCAGLEGAYQRLSVALLHLPLLSTEPTVLVHLSRLVHLFGEYNWLTAVREFEQITTWRPANIAELARLGAHINNMQAEVVAFRDAIGDLR
jgi:hypothetical protein